MKLSKAELKKLESEGLIESKISPKRAAWNGNDPEGVKKPREKNMGRSLAFDAMCKAHGLPHPIPEYQFAQEIGRRWRFDWLFDGLVALEIQGGVWTQGHHSRGQGQIDDFEKFNQAQLMGYIVLLVTPEQVDSGEAFALVKRALAGGES